MKNQCEYRVNKYYIPFGKETGSYFGKHLANNFTASGNLVSGMFRMVYLTDPFSPLMVGVKVLQILSGSNELSAMALPLPFFGAASIELAAKIPTNIQITQFLSNIFNSQS